ncbi:d-arabinitol dehydrogenase [Grosmannia clavigera kw1407]|uniref:D-arabinitol dehydrogenase n=1 Tax=Grosmannia clavigera (strain kw1407 / UAMH 11150) TaxID=655863 RepID=F0XK44_GROCL|nr:d-arabinitol dehydrogenase [Grosmannia clavigera kw1407]EFX01896.1 d-arabinitol dehydrogenase [Grosmannia clavigera kw1407]
MSTSALSTIGPPNFSLRGKLVLLTGGAQGLGLAMGQAIVASGADLALVDLNKHEAQVQADLMMDAFEAKHPNQRPPIVTGHYANVADETSVDACVAEVVATHAATISGLVTSAGFVENFPAEDYPPACMRALWAVNVDGTYLFATAVARHLQNARAAATVETGTGKQVPEASMVLVGSMSGAIVNVPQPQAPYNISKAAVRHMAASLAVEWASAGIRVNCLSPGYMQTPLTAALLNADPALRRRWITGVPQGRLGLPADLAGPVVFLLSDAARYVTGADLRVDGGYTLI